MNADGFKFKAVGLYEQCGNELIGKEMARIRTLKPDFWLSESIAKLPFETRLLAIALLNYADDEGYFKAHPSLVKASCFPLDDSLSIPRMLQELSNDGYIRIGKADDGTTIGQVINFLAHQRIDKPTKSKFAVKSIAWNTLVDSSANTPRVIAEPSHPEGKGKEGKVKEETPLSRKRDDVGKNGELNEAADRVIDFLNLKSGKNFRHVEVNRAFIRARLGSGATEQDCKSVIARKERDWRNTEQWKYMRPETLFNAKKFESYIGELVEAQPTVRSV